MDKNLWGVPKDPPGLNRVKAWRNGPALFAQHQYLELGHFCLPVSPVTNCAWRNWQESTEQETFACRQAKNVFDLN